MRQIEIGERIGAIKVVEIFMENGHRIARCQCDCGAVVLKRTYHLSRKAEDSCGCLRKAMKREKLAEARKLRKRSVEDPTPLEIAERCMWIHEDAGRELPVGLVEILDGFRKNMSHQQSEFPEHVRTDSSGTSRRQTVALLARRERHEDPSTDRRDIGKVK